MKEETAKLFAKLMEKGHISREQDPLFYEYSLDVEVMDEFETMKSEWGFDTHRINGRLYLIPKPDSDLLAQGKSDIFKTDKNENIYLYSYIAMFILHELYGGKGTNLETRYWVTEQEFTEVFTKHCERVVSNDELFKTKSEQYSIDFKKLAESWLAKRGDDTMSVDSKHGCFMKVMNKLMDEELLYKTENQFKPTIKLSDLMPYFLAQNRIAEIHAILGGETDAEIT